MLQRGQAENYPHPIGWLPFFGGSFENERSFMPQGWFSWRLLKSTIPTLVSPSSLSAPARGSVSSSKIQNEPCYPSRWSLLAPFPAGLLASFSGPWQRYSEEDWSPNKHVRARRDWSEEWWSFPEMMCLLWKPYCSVSVSWNASLECFFFPPLWLHYIKTTVTCCKPPPHFL